MASSSSGGTRLVNTDKLMHTKTQEIINHFSTSGAAVCIATATTHPLDVVKVRLQLENVGRRASSSSMGQKLVHMVRDEGIQSLYKGIAPSLLRSALYGGLRLGLYEPCKEAFDWAFSETNIFTKIAAGALSGAIATATANPMEVMKVRMQVSQGPSNKSIFKEMKNILSIEGIPGLWRGLGPSMARASALTASQMATYDESKQIIKHWTDLEEGFWLHISASLVAGIVGTTTTSPIDTVKTRMMIQKQVSDNLYRNSFDCMHKIWKSEGLPGLYKGWSATFARLGPQTAITFLIYEKLRQVVGIKAL